MIIKIHFVPESNEKPQQFYHNLHLHAYGTEAEKAAQITNREVLAWGYSEVVWNEPYEKFYDMLIAAGREFIAAGKMGALSSTIGKKKGGKGKGMEKPANPLERTALIPEHSSPGQPFSKEIEQLELEKLNEGRRKIEEMIKIITAENKIREAENAKLRAAVAAKEAKEAAAKAAKASGGAQ
jgi:YEATS domain-containing protein 4